ncbi:MAG: beta-lactamase family protein [Anaerolineaceae bacterium]|nr:beta-lactamase family protein [Anaerolineaceae bacterium]
MNKKFLTQIIASLFFLIVLSLIDVLMSISAESSLNQEINFAEMNHYIESQMNKHGLKGVSLAITEGDQIVYLKGYGTAGEKRPMTPQTPMYIGSQSKSFTGLAISQLVQAGKIDPSKPVIDYIPDFRIADQNATRKITINHLLHHVSGLSEAGFIAILPDTASKQDLIDALAEATLTAPIGTKFQYFNVGYDVLAIVIENVTGITYDQYINENIFIPLEMSNSFTDPIVAREHGLSQGYTRFFGFPVPTEQPHREYEVSAGYIISSAEDLAKYAIALLNDGKFKNLEIINKDGLQMLFKPVQNYGMGWFISPDRFFHGGANETFRAEIDLIPSRKLGIVLLINQGYMVDHFISGPQVMNGVREIALGKEPQSISSGWSVRTIGSGLLVLVLGLITLQTFNFLKLSKWKERAKNWSVIKTIWEVAISFIIPTVILVVVFSQIKGFFGTRFNWTYQILMMFRSLPDISILMIVGSVPDYVQGFIKLFWAINQKKRRLVNRQAHEMEIG